MFLRIRRPVGHADIFTQFLLGFILPVVLVFVTGIRYKRHFSHLGNGNGGKMVIYLNNAQ